MGQYAHAQAALKGAMAAEAAKAKREEEGEKEGRGRWEAAAEKAVEAAVGRVEDAAGKEAEGFQQALAQRETQVGSHGCSPRFVLRARAFAFALLTEGVSSCLQVETLEGKVKRLEAERRLSSKVAKAEHALKEKMEGRLDELARKDKAREDAMLADLKEDREREETLFKEREEKDEKLAVEKAKVKSAREEGLEAIRFAREKQVRGERECAGGSARAALTTHASKVRRALLALLRIKDRAAGSRVHGKAELMDALCGRGECRWHTRWRGTTRRSRRGWRGRSASCGRAGLRRRRW